MEHEEQSWGQQFDQKAIDLRNEAIVQAATAYEFGHRVVRTGIGTIFLSIDHVQALFEHAAKRGEQMESDAQRAVGDLRQQTGQAASGMRSTASTHITAAVSSGVASLLNRLPGISIAYSAPPAAGAPVDGGAQPATDGSAQGGN